MANQTLVLRLGDHVLGDWIDILTNAVELYRDNLIKRDLETAIVDEMVVAFHDRLIAKALHVDPTERTDSLSLSWEDETE